MKTQLPKQQTQLLNPFTPSEIAATPDQFFGRTREIELIERAMPLGSVLIQGPVGIGKSSLTARALDVLAGFDSEHKCVPVVVVADRDIENLNQAARRVLDRLAEVDDEKKSARLKFGLDTAIGEAFVELGGDVTRSYRDGEYLAVLKRLVERDHKRRQAAGQMLLIGIDEADKAPVPLGRLVRSLTTDMQQVGVRDVRFVLAGVSPLLQGVTSEDPGVARAFNRIINLEPMELDEARTMLSEKLELVRGDAERRGWTLRTHPDVIERIACLSGGHPHVVQLLGSHLIDHENSDPDGVLDSSDLVGSLRRVCFEDRGPAYASALHMLEIAGKLDALTTLLNRGPLVNDGFPTVISRERALDAVGEADIQWLVEHGVLVPRSAVEYGLVDEFLRVRLAMAATEPALVDELERELIEQGRFLSDVDDLDQSLEQRPRRRRDGRVER